MSWSQTGTPVRRGLKDVWRSGAAAAAARGTGWLIARAVALCGVAGGLVIIDAPGGLPSLFRLGPSAAAAQESPLTGATPVRPVKETLTKSALINLVAEQNDLPRKTAAAVYATLEGVFLGSVHPRGVGEFILPGLLKVSLRKVPARKAGTLVSNPATGQMVKGAAKPASVRVNIRALSKLKTAAVSQ